MHPDRIHAGCVDHRERFAVAKEQWRTALRAAQSMCGQPPRFHFTNFNGTSVAKRIVNARGQPLPESRGELGKRTTVDGRCERAFTVTADDPYTLWESIRDRDVATWWLTGDGEIRGWLVAHSSADMGRLLKGRSCG